MVHEVGESAAAPRIVTGTLPFSRSSAFELVLPRANASGSPAPLLVALHGFAETGARFRERLAPLVETGFALLVPDGPYPVEVRTESPPRVGYAWYQYTGDAVAFAAALREVGGFVDRLIDAAADAHPIDRAAIVLLGYSQGGYLAGAHALSHPDRFAGLVAIATRIKSELFSPQQLARVRFPVLAIHGENDPATPIARQRDSIDALRAAGVDASLVSHPGGHGLRRESVTEVAGYLRRIFRPG